MNAEETKLLGKYIESLGWRQLSQRTVKTWESNLTKFLNEVGLRAATPEGLRAWLDRDIQPQTQVLWLEIIHLFYSWINQEGYLPRVKHPRSGRMVDFDPTKAVIRPKTPSRYPVPIGVVGLRAAVSDADPQLKVWILLGALAGCRCKEIAGIRRQDLHLEDEQPWLQIAFGKGNKQRSVVMHPELHKAFLQLKLPDDGPLWETTAAKVSNIINAQLHRHESLRVDGEPATAHSLRHFAGTSWYQSSLDLKLVADLMGHANIRTTAGYAAADQTKAAAVVSGVQM